MKRLICIAVVLSAMVVTPLWAAESTKPNKAVAKPRSAPKIKEQIKPLPAGSAGILTPATLNADLQVGVIKVSPHNPGEGRKVTFEGNVMNYGMGSAYHPVVFMTITGPPGVTIPFFRKELNVNLAKNHGTTFVHQFIVPKPGNYICNVKLDPARMIAETNDNNNEKNLTFSVHALPDLIVCISNGKRPPVGGKRDIHAVIKNIGHAASHHLSNMRLRFYVEGKGTKFYDIPSISPGQDHTITRKHNWHTAGTKTITAKVSHPGYDEINNQNNEVSGSYFVRLPHHDTYAAAPRVKCSTNVNFYSWEECNNQY